LAEAQFGERTIFEDGFGGEIGCLFGDQNGHSAVLLWETGGKENWDWLDGSGGMDVPIVGIVWESSSLGVQMPRRSGTNPSVLCGMFKERPGYCF
jgi:hypothetical protein